MIELSNKEMYSSRVRDFSVKGRQSHPKRDGQGGADYTLGFNSSSWHLIGTFTAANVKGVQSFQSLAPNRLRVRYLLVQFLTHYGTEEVCALNQFKVKFQGSPFNSFILVISFQCHHGLVTHLMHGYGDQVLGVSAAQELEAALARQMEEPSEEQRLQQQATASASGQTQSSSSESCGDEEGTASTTGCSAGTTLSPERPHIVPTPEALLPSQCRSQGATINSTHPLSKLLPTTLLSTLGMHVSLVSARPEACSVAPAVSSKPSDLPDATSTPLAAAVGDISLGSEIIKEDRLGDEPPVEVSAILPKDEPLEKSEETGERDSFNLLPADPAVDLTAVMGGHDSNTGLEANVLDNGLKPNYLEGSLGPLDLLEDVPIELHHDIIPVSMHDIANEPSAHVATEEATSDPSSTSELPDEDSNDGDGGSNQSAIAAPDATSTSSEKSSIPLEGLKDKLQQGQGPPSSQTSDHQKPAVPPGDQRPAAIALPPILSGSATLPSTAERKGVPAVTSTYRPRVAGNLFDVFKQVGDPLTCDPHIVYEVHNNITPEEIDLCLHQCHAHTTHTFCGIPLTSKIGIHALEAQPDEDVEVHVAGGLIDQPECRRHVL